MENKKEIRQMKMRKLMLVMMVFASMDLFAYWIDRCPPEVFAKVKDSIVVITSENSSGTGFIVDMDGSRWLMTNAHVVRGEGKFRARTLAGQKIMPTNTVDIAANRDLIRYKIDGDFKALTWRSAPPSMNEDVWVFGNSDGSGVVTSIGGEVIGLGVDKVEVSAAFVAGNSGSPVVDKNGDVIGVATFAEIKQDYSNWVKVGTRFNDVRRFAETVEGVVWEPLGYDQYLKDCAAIHSCAEQCLGFMSVITSIGHTFDGKPMFKSAKEVEDTSVAAIKKDKISRKVYDAIKAADATYEKAVKAYKDTQLKMNSSQGKGKIDRPTETTLRRRQKDVDGAYQAMLKKRREGLLRAKTLVRECNVKSERAKVEIEKIRDIMNEVVDDFNDVCKKLGKK